MPPRDITVLLAGVRSGVPGCESELAERVNAELRRIAAIQLRKERPGHTLQPSALVNEVWIRLMGTRDANWDNRAHFFAAAAASMRRILIDYARARTALKRPGRFHRVELTEGLGYSEKDPEKMLALDEALRRLAVLDARQSRVVELRFFAGLDMSEIAAVLGVSEKTVKRDWKSARAWLLGELASPAHDR